MMGRIQTITSTLQSTSTVSMSIPLSSTLKKGVHKTQTHHSVVHGILTDEGSRRGHPIKVPDSARARRTTRENKCITDMGVESMFPDLTDSWDVTVRTLEV